MRLNEPAALLLSLTVMAFAPACDGRGGGGPGDATSNPHATELSIDQVSLYQGTEARFMEDQEAENPEAPVVAGRDALLRVFVNTHSDWEDREIEAELSLHQMEWDDEEDEWVPGTTKRYQETFEVVIDSSDSSKSSTFNFEIDGDDLTEGVSYRVDLYETEPEEGPGDVKRPHWPDIGDDPQELDPRDSGEQVRIVIVPLEYRADGSRRLPDTSDSQIELLHDHLMAQYPTRKIDIEVEDPVPWNNTISPNGSGFDRVLEYLYGIRDRYDYDVYLYGLHAPSPSYFDFCQGGCVAGLSSLAQSAGDSWARVSTGLGFEGEGTAGTMVHEVGHAHGRSHAPCGTQGDGGFPHSGGSIGVWGYDIIEKTLKSPNLHTDFMGYCDPTWVSDYTFDALFDRVRQVNGARDVRNIEALPTFRTVVQGVDGTLRWSRNVRMVELPAQAAPRTVELLDGEGAVLDTVVGRLTPFSHLSGGFLHLPDFGDDVASVRVVGHGLLPVE